MTASPSTLQTPPSAAPLLTLLLCDLVGSTALVEKLGDLRGAAMMRRHDREARDALHRYGGHEIDRTDGFLLLFDQPTQALSFALEYQRAVRAVGDEIGVRLRARVALHAGEMQRWAHSPEDIAAGAKPLEVAGQSRVIVSELLGYARPGQILLTESVEALCRPVLANAALDGRPLRWRAYGRYPLRSLGGPAGLFEAGEPRFAPFQTPAMPGGWRRHWRRGVVGVVAALLLAVGGWYWSRPGGLAFAERDWAVVASLQNDTRHPELSEAIETVFRIGLQQSRYVNVVPPAQIQEALRRMRRPEEAAIDRAVGLQVALREGARALIVPSLTEAGAGFRMTVELVEPASGVSVFSSVEAAEDLSDLLPATDRLLAQLRRKMGESLAAIAESSGPLERITTSNLDALGKLAQAEAEFAQGAVEAGIRSLDEVLALDPEFAMALARRGIVELHWLGQPDRALQSWTAALALADKLSDRERRALQALYDGSFGTLAEAVGGWNSYVQLYPDAVNGKHNLAAVLRSRQHRVTDALPLFRESAQSRHPMRSLSWLALSDSLTELGDIAGAHAAIAEAEALGMQAPMFNAVFPDLVERRYQDVNLRLQDRGELAPPRRAERDLRLAASLTDQGRLREAIALLEQLAALPLPTVQAARIELQQCALLLAAGDAGAKARLTRFIDQQQQRAATVDPRLTRETLLPLAFAAALAARYRLPSLAKAALAAANQIGELPGHYVEPAFLRLARCEVVHAAHPQTRVECLQPLIDGREFFQMHVALADALLAAGFFRDAFEQTQWVLSHRGAAVAELEDWPLQLPNLLDANRAHLVATEAAWAMAEPMLANGELGRFVLHWQQGDRDSRIWQQAERLAQTLKVSTAAPR